MVVSACLTLRRSGFGRTCILIALLSLVIALGRILCAEPFLATRMLEGTQDVAIDNKLPSTGLQVSNSPRVYEPLPESLK